MLPTEECIFWVSNLRFSFSVGLQKVISIFLADPRSSAVGEEESWAAGGLAPGLALGNDSVPYAGSKVCNYIFYYYLFIIQVITAQLEAWSRSWWMQKKASHCAGVWVSQFFCSEMLINGALRKRRLISRQQIEKLPIGGIQEPLGIEFCWANKS